MNGLNKIKALRATGHMRKGSPEQTIKGLKLGKISTGSRSPSAIKSLKAK